VKGKLEYERLETQRFIAKHNIRDFRFNPHFPVNTLLIMRGLVASRRVIAGDVYLETVLKAMWEDGQKMDDPAVVASVLGAAGLDAKSILEAAQDPDVKAELAANTSAAAARGAFGIPTFFVGEEMFFGKERLGQVEEELRKAISRDSDRRPD
jgi:2-hydroxychromene-2-carboxylate isomerase